MNARCLLLSLAFVTASLFGQQSSNKGTTTFYPAKPINPLPPPPPMMEMPLVSPLFLEGGHFGSTLTLVNNSEANTYADLTVRGLDGTAIATRRVKFTPHSQRQVQIGELLGGADSAATAGSILIMQSSALAGPSIAAALSMTYAGSADPNYIDEETSMPNPAGSQMLEGVADQSNGSPIVAISSVAESVQHITVQCIGQRGVIASNHVDLGVGETIISDVCSGREIHGTDFHASLERDEDASHGPVGIKLKSDAMPGSFAAFALAPHRKNGDHFFSSVLFTDPMMTNSPNTVFTGIPVGSATLLPDGNYTPRISMANFSTADIHAHIDFARTSGDRPQSREVSSLTIPAGASREVVLSDIDGDSGLQNSFVLRSDGAPGALVAKLVSSSESRLHEVELQAKEASDMENAGNHPWSLEQNTESTLLLFNHSGTFQTFNVWIYGEDVEWVKSYKLAAMQTKAISIRDLVDSHVKDDKGHVLPQTVRRGELNWMAVDPNQGSGRLLQSDRTTAMARNFSCGYTGLLCGENFTIYTETFADGTTVDYAVQVPWWCTGGQQNACSGQRTGPGGSANFSWNSGSPSIASISGSSSSSNVNLLGVSQGTSQINGQVRTQYCMSGGGGPANVLTPSQMLFFSDVTTTSSVCTPHSDDGVERIIQYQVTNSNSQAVPGISVKEDFSSSPPVSTCRTAGAPSPTGCTTLGGSGIITDRIATNACSPPDPGNCGWSINPDHWELCNGSVLGSPKYTALWQAVYVDGSTATVPLLTVVPK